MLRTILVGLDPSDGSRAAVGQGIEWAGRSGAELTGVAVVDEAAGDGSPTGVGGAHYQARVAAARSARARAVTAKLRDEFAGRCRAAGVRFTARVETGDPVGVLLGLHEDFDLTMLSQEPRFRFVTDEGPDDTLTDVLRVARRPVVAVPAAVPAGCGVVVGYDGGEAAADALMSFARSGLGAGVPVGVVAVADERPTAEARAAEAVRFLAAHDIPAEARPVVSRTGHEAEVLRAAADRSNARMVVMGAFTHGRLREWYDRSTTRRMLATGSRLLYLQHHPEN